LFAVPRAPLPQWEHRTVRSGRRFLADLQALLQ
jgi:hypothetical protein